jgi:hypothetical protein
MSGQLASRPGRLIPRVHYMEAGWAPEPAWTLWEEKKLLTLTGIEPRPSNL